MLPVKPSTILILTRLLALDTEESSMKKLNYSDTQTLQLVDTRSQQAFQARHAKGALNLNPSVFDKFAHHFLNTDQAIAFVLETEAPSSLSELEALVQENGYTQVKGYLLADDIPAKDRQAIATISVEEFLEQDKDFTLLDLRNPAEITRAAPDTNLTNLPLENLANDYSMLQPGQTIYTLCGSGNRATVAASFLNQQGYQAVVIEGGMKAVEANRQA